MVFDPVRPDRVTVRQCEPLALNLLKAAAA